MLSLELECIITKRKCMYVNVSFINICCQQDNLSVIEGSTVYMYTLYVIVSRSTHCPSSQGWVP